MNILFSKSLPFFILFSEIYSTSSFTLQSRPRLVVQTPQIFQVGPNPLLFKDRTVLRAQQDEDDRVVAYIADKGLEGDGPLGVVNKIVPPGFRIALYVLFGIVGGAGVVVDVLLEKPADGLIDAVGLAVAVALFIFDRSLTQGQVEATKSAMAEDRLGKGVWKDAGSMESGEAAELMREDGADGMVTATEVFGEEEYR